MMKRRIMHGIILIFCLAVLFHFRPAWAEEAKGGKEASEKGVFNLGEVVVKGKAETVTGVATVDIVDRERLDLTNSMNVSDALNTLPGVYFSVGTKNERNINVRGFNQRYVPVFMDGIPVYIPYDGYVDTGNLPTGSISQISLTKGISSVLYGPNGMGGVINIVSRKPEKPFEGDYRVDMIEGGTVNINTNLGSRLDKLYYTVSFGHMDSDGFPLSGKFTPTANEKGGIRDNSDIYQYNWSTKIGFMPAKGHEYAFGIQKVDLEKGLPPSATDANPRFWRFTDWRKTTYYLIGDSELTDQFAIKSRLYHDTYFNLLDAYDNNNYTTQARPSAFHSTYDDYSNGASFVFRSKHVSRNTLSFSFHYKDDVHEEQDNFFAAWERYEQEMLSYGLEDDIKLTDNLSFVIGASFDQQKPVYANGAALRDDEDSINPQAGLRWTVLEDTDLHFSVGRKTRFPTLFELYSGQFGRNIPNPDLAEEKAINYEVGLDKPLPGNTKLSLAVFNSDVEDLIVRRNITANTTKYENIGEARFIGSEISLRSGLFAYNDLELSYTYLDAEDRSPTRTSDHLPENSEHKLYMSDLYKLNDIVSFFGKLEWNSKRYYEVTGATGRWETLAGFWTVDAKAILTAVKNVNVEIGAKNIFDDNYELSAGFPREGRTFFLSVRGTF